MILLKQFDIDFEKGFSFYSSNLKDVNALSEALLLLVDFKKGRFFTLLPRNVATKQMYQFNLGGIAIKVRDTCPEFILDRLKKNKNLICIFDDVLRSPGDKYKMDLFDSCSITYQDEIYYLLRDNFTEESIQCCLQASNAIWHSLCVISKITIDIKKELSKEDINKIALESKMIILGAYDGEGYLFWEKK